MALATGARHDLSYVAEVTFGATPNTPTMKYLRQTGNTLALAKNALASAELRADRQIPFIRHGQRRVQGDISFELSYGAFDDILEGALFGAWSTNVLKVGTTQKFYTFERRFVDVSEYYRFTGCMVNTLSLSIRPDAIVTGSFGIVGKDMANASSALGSPTDVASNEPFDSFTGTIEEGGASIATVTALDINIDNGLDPAMVVGASTTPQFFAGRSNVTGTLSAYFETEALLQKFIDETETSIEVVLEDVDGNSLTILLPRIKYTGGAMDVTNEDGVVVNMPFQAVRDSSEATNLKLTRAAA